MAAAIALAGCWSNSQRLETFLEAQGPKPGWVTSSEDSFKQGELIVFKATVQRQKDLPLALQTARVQARAMIATSIQDSLDSAFGVARNGRNNDVDNRTAEGGSIQSDISEIARTTRLMGVTPKESYWEKIEFLIADGDRIVGYNVWATVSIAERDLKRARIAAEERAMGLATARKDDEAKARLTESLQRLRDELTQ
jgi:hypothetical protein